MIWFQIGAINFPGPNVYYYKGKTKASCNHKCHCIDFTPEINQGIEVTHGKLDRVTNT